MKLTKSKPYLIAETAFHHEGDLQYILGLIDAAAQAKCDAIKFQVLMDFDYLVNKNHGAYSTLKKFTFSKKEWQQIFDTAVAKNLRIVSLPLDLEAVSFTKLNEEKVDLIEIHSVSFYDEKLIDEIKTTSIPVFLGVGGRTIEEIDNIKSILGEQLWGLIVGFQAFPSELKDVKLPKVTYLKQAYPSLKVGYTDHSSFDSTNAVISNYVALGLGASFFEKHLTLNEGVERTDFHSAVGEEKLKEINENLIQLAEALAHENKTINQIEGPEVNYRNRQKKAFAAHDVKKGTVLTTADIKFQMTDNMAEGFYGLEQLLGKEVALDLLTETFIEKKHLA